MTDDLGPMLEDWPAEPGQIRVRRLTTDDGRDAIQLRVDLGILQMTMSGRPDGERPFGRPDMRAYLDQLDPRPAELSELSDDEAEELDRELLQFYRRRISLMALGADARLNDRRDESILCFEQAIIDAEHNLALLDWLDSRAADRDYAHSHTRYRPLILTHRAICRAERALLDHQADHAIEAIKAGKQSVQAWAEHHADPEDDETDIDGYLAELRQYERRIRKQFGRKRTLREQLDDAIAAEDYEKAAFLRDTLDRQRHHPRP